MRTLILLGLCVLAAVCNADSSESNEIDDVLFLGRGDAYSFMRPQRRQYQWGRSRVKSVYEMNREQCEEYPPCDHLMRPVRNRHTYNGFLGGGWVPSRPVQGPSKPHRRTTGRVRNPYYGY